MQMMMMIPNCAPSTSCCHSPLSLKELLFPTFELPSNDYNTSYIWNHLSKLTRLEKNMRRSSPIYDKTQDHHAYKVQVTSLINTSLAYITCGQVPSHIDPAQGPLNKTTVLPITSKCTCWRFTMIQLVALRRHLPQDTHSKASLTIFN